MKRQEPSLHKDPSKEIDVESFGFGMLEPINLGKGKCPIEKTAVEGIIHYAGGRTKTPGEVASQISPCSA